MIVVDSGFVVDALADAPGASLLRDRARGEELHAPHLLDHEVVSVVRGLVLGRRLSVSRGAEVLADFDDLPITRWQASAPLRRRALALRHNVSAYDAAYLALAEALECPLVTRDRRLAKVTGHEARVALC